MTAQRDLRNKDESPWTPAGAHPTAGDDPHPDYQLTLADEQDFVPVDADWLLWIAASVLQGERVGRAELSFALVDNAVIQEINRRFLGHDFPTDVISFPLHEDDGGNHGGTLHIDGEIIVSGETALRVAEEMGRPPSEEIALYVVHGLLHLCGFDDQDDISRDVMRRRQQWHFKRFTIQPHY